MPRPDELERTEPLSDGSPLDRLVKQHRIEKSEGNSPKSEGNSPACPDCERARPFADLCPRCFAKAMGPDDSLSHIRNEVLNTLKERVLWYRDGCEGLEDREGYYASGDCARDAASDLETALSEIRVLESVIAKLRSHPAREGTS